MTIVVKRPKLTSPFMSVTIKRHGDRINVNGPQKVNYCNFNSISPNISNGKLNISRKSSVGSSLNSPYDSEVKLLDRWWDDGEKTEGHRATSTLARLLLWRIGGNSRSASQKRRPLTEISTSLVSSQAPVHPRSSLLLLSILLQSFCYITSSASSTSTHQ